MNAFMDDGNPMNSMNPLNAIPETILGIPGVTFTLIIAVVFIAWILTKRIENFTGARPLVTKEEYAQDVRNVASFVGPYIGDTYLYLRGKYAADGKIVPMFTPGGIDDPTLSDPLLPISRAQVKGWIDSNNLRFKQKYGEEFMRMMSPVWGLSYKDKGGGIIEVTYTENGKVSVYIV